MKIPFYTFHIAFNSSAVTSTFAIAIKAVPCFKLEKMEWIKLKALSEVGGSRLLLPLVDASI
jgi:hypothetical protein